VSQNLLHQQRMYGCSVRLMYELIEESAQTSHNAVY